MADLTGIFKASFNHDGSRVLVRTREGAVGLWNVATGAPVPGDLGTKAEGEASVWSAAARRVLVDFKAGGAHCLLMGRAGSVLRYDARTWKPAGPALRQHDDIAGPSVEVSPNGKWLLSWGSDRSLRLLDAATGAVRGSHSSGAAIAQVVTDAAGGCVLFDNTAFLLQNHHAFYVVKMDFADHPFAPFPGSRATQRSLARRHPVAQLPVFTSTMSCGALSRWAAGLTRM